MRSLPDRVQAFRFPPGFAGTVSTIALMSSLALKGMQNPRIRARARELVAGIAMQDWLARVGAVWAFILDNVTYVPNTLGLQHLTDPARLDQEIDEGAAGECCASISVYAAALLGSIGLKSRFVVIGYRPREPEKLKHVYLEVLDPSRPQDYVQFDPVGAMRFGEDSFSLGDSLHLPGLPIQRFTLEGKQTALGCADCGGCVDMSDVLLGCGHADPLGDPLDDLERLRQGEAIAKGVVETVTGVVSQFGPPGQIAAGVVQIGKSVYETATGRKLGEAVNVPGSTSSPPFAEGVMTPATPGAGGATEPPMRMLRKPTGEAWKELRRAAAEPPKTDTPVLPLAVGAGVLAALVL